jgi:4-coumarate--CoA ligase (photoactive yellow protein activation family)
MLLNLRGSVLSVSDGAATFQNALITASSWLASGMCGKVLLAAVDEINPVVFAQYNEKIKTKAGAAAFLLKPVSAGSHNPAVLGKGGCDSVGGFAFADNAVFEHSEITASVDEFNPSLSAFDFARFLQPFILPQEAARISRDFIKTYLAGNKSDILSVFENKAPADLLAGVEKEQKKKIYAGLRLLCNAKSSAVIAQTRNMQPENDGHDGFFAGAALPETNDDECRVWNFEDDKAIETTVYNEFSKSDAINFFTSGSTGLPKNCVHTKEMINEEVSGLAFLFRDIARIVSTVPTHHSYGFIFGLRMPRFLDVPVELKIPSPVLRWGDILRGGDLFIAFPSFLKYLADFDFKFPQDVTILTSTAPCPDELRDKLYENGAERVIEIYGASEAGAIAFREKSGLPFTLLPYWNFEIKSGAVEKFSRKRSSLAVEPPDILKLTGDGKFFVAGRKDNAVQVAGVNVYPSKVEKILKENALVKDAAVRLGGERLKAFVVLKNAADEDKAKKDLRDYLQKKLTAHEMPKHITFGPAVPATPFGKKADW